MEPQEYKWENWKVLGTSAAGTGTCFTIPQVKVAIDTAQGWPFAYSMNHLFLTHAHIDHAGGLAYIVSQRGLMGLKGLKIYALPEIVEDLESILRTWERLEGFQYDFEMIPFATGDTAKINDKVSVKSFATKHRVPSQGYCVLDKSKTLKAEYKNLDGQELRDLRSQGVEIDEYFDQPIFAYTGDTEIDFINMCEEVILKSKMLFIDCTYYDEKKSVAHAQEWGHIHFKQVVENIDRFHCENLVLTHPSRRYKKSDLEKIVNDRFPNRSTPNPDISRIALFP